MMLERLGGWCMWMLTAWLTSNKVEFFMWQSTSSSSSLIGKVHVPSVKRKAKESAIIYFIKYWLWVSKKSMHKNTYTHQRFLFWRSPGREDCRNLERQRSSSLPHIHQKWKWCLTPCKKMWRFLESLPSLALLSRLTFQHLWKPPYQKSSGLSGDLPGMPGGWT